MNLLEPCSQEVLTAVVNGELSDAIRALHQLREGDDSARPMYAATLLALQEAMQPAQRLAGAAVAASQYAAADARVARYEGLIP